jgi:thioredoxin-like negative regulator of GroEL
MGILDIDENRKLADEFGVYALPTLLFFKKNNLFDRVTGVISRKELKNRVKSLL